MLKLQETRQRENHERNQEGKHFFYRGTEKNSLKISEKNFLKERMPADSPPLLPKKDVSKKIEENL